MTLFLTTHALSQEPVAAFRPDALVVVTRHPTGADLVEIKMRAVDYPVDLLAQQIEDFGRRLGSAPRGAIPARSGGDPRAAVVSSGRFAVDGLLDPATGSIRLQPLVQAMAGAPEPHTVMHLLVLLDGQKPTASTLRQFDSPAVQLSGMFYDGRSGPAGLEYRITLKTQVADAIKLPDRIEPEAPNTASNTRGNGPGVAFWGIVALISLAGGALVYFALLRGGDRSARRR